MINKEMTSLFSHMGNSASSQTLPLWKLSTTEAETGPTGSHDIVADLLSESLSMHLLRIKMSLLEKTQRCDSLSSVSLQKPVMLTINT